MTTESCATSMTAGSSFSWSMLRIDARFTSADKKRKAPASLAAAGAFETINDFTAAALREFPEQYREIIVGYNSILERYCRGNYLNAERKRKCVEQSGAKE